MEQRASLARGIAVKPAEPSENRSPRTTSLARGMPLPVSTTRPRENVVSSLARGVALPRSQVPSPNASFASQHSRNEPISMRGQSTSRHSTSQDSNKSIGDLAQDVAELSLKNNIILNRNADAESEKKEHFVDLYANYIQLELKADYNAFEYRVTFTPEIDYRSYRFKFIKELDDRIGKVHNFDGTTLYLPKKLKKEKNCYTTVHPVTEESVKVEITFVKEKKLSESPHIFNVLFKRIMKELKLKRIGQHSFDPSSAQMIPQYRLQIWPGYVTSIAEYDGGLMLNLDPMHKILRTNSVHSFIKELVEKPSGRVDETIRAALIGKAVLTPYNNKVYTIEDVDFSINPMSSFQYRDKETITYVQYYKDNYDITITDLKQPMLINRIRNRKSMSEEFEEKYVCLIPELCIFTGLTDEMKNNFRLMKDLAQHTLITPNQRFTALKRFIQRVKENTRCSEFLSDWGLSLCDCPVSFKAIELRSEAIVFGNDTVNTQERGSWQREILQNHVISAVDIIDWAVLYVKKDERYVREFFQCIMRCGNPMGINVSQPKTYVLNSDRTESYISKLNEIINPRLQIVMCICPTSRDDRYAAIKKICCVDNPIPSQVINAPTISNQVKLRAVSQKVLLQMNCKLGGTLWSVRIPPKKLMVIGLDVYHSPSSDVKSVCGFVASYDVNITRWLSRVCFQRPGQEIIDEARHCFADALKLYYQTNGFFPEQIVIYRDGVGDGQLDFCRDYEVTQFVSCISKINEVYNPSIVFIVVQKRNNTRVFLQLQNQGLSNPQPGTVVNSTILRKNMYDFYIISQKVRQGCLVPTHYVVIYNSSEFTPLMLQKLTYKMCHLYYNWPGTVRVPAPCQYAHKLAYLVGNSLKRKPDPKLERGLFYL